MDSVFDYASRDALAACLDHRRRPQLGPPTQVTHTSLTDASAATEPCNAQGTTPRKDRRMARAARTAVARACNARPPVAGSPNRSCIGHRTAPRAFRSARPARRGIGRVGMRPGCTEARVGTGRHLVAARSARELNHIAADPGEL